MALDQNEFPRKKIVLGRKNQLVAGENKKSKTNILVNYTARLQKDCFFVFTRKSWFSVENPFFRKKMALGRQTHFCLAKSWFGVEKNNFFLGQRWFWAGKPSFFLGRTKKTICLESGRTVSPQLFWVFPKKQLGFLAQGHLFPRKYLPFLHRKPNFS